MLEKLRRTKSPQQRKEEACANEHRYCYEYRNAAVRAWARKKRRNQREARHKVKQLAVQAVLLFDDEEAADRFADNARVLRSYRKLHKSGVLTLRDVIEHKRATGRRPIYRLKEGKPTNGQGEIRADEAALQRRHDRAR